jgi:hypothetical protein
MNQLGAPHLWPTAEREGGVADAMTEPA